MSNEKDYENKVNNDDAIDAEIVDDELKNEETGFSFGQVDDENNESINDVNEETSDEEQEEQLSEDTNYDADERESFDSSEEDSKELTENLEELNESPDSNNDSSDDEDASASNDEADFKENFRDEIEAIKEEKRRQALEQKNAEIAQKRKERERQQLLKEEKKLEAQKERQRKFEEMAQKRAVEHNKSEEEKSVAQAQKRRDKIVSSPKLAKKLRKKNLEIERYEPDINVGLTEEQIDKRISAGLNNYKSMGSTKTISQIIIGNIVTPFNILIFIIAGFLISVNSIKDLTFLVIVLLNLVIGIIQEISAKKTIDKLTLISAPTCDVLRDSKFQEVTINEVVLDDLISLKTGKQICSDSIVVEGQIEVNESLLTGEADAIIKKPGDILYSGSFVVSGTCIARVDKVGDDNYIERLTGQAKQYKKPNSELLKALNKII